MSVAESTSKTVSDTWDLYVVDYSFIFGHYRDPEHVISFIGCSLEGRLHDVWQMPIK